MMLEDAAYVNNIRSTTLLVGVVNESIVHDMPVHALGAVQVLRLVDDAQHQHALNVISIDLSLNLQFQKTLSAFLLLMALLTLTNLLRETD